MKRAKSDLGVKSVKRGNEWFWVMEPNQGYQAAQESHQVQEPVGSANAPDTLDTLDTLPHYCRREPSGAVRGGEDEQRSGAYARACEGGAKRSLRGRDGGSERKAAEYAESLNSHTRPNLLIDIQSKMQSGYGEGFRQWAKVENLKQSAKTLVYLKEVGIDSYEELISQHNSVGQEFHKRNQRLKEVEKRLAAITELQKQIGTYSKTRAAWERYKKSGYDAGLFEIERADLTLHKAAKKYFDEHGFKGKLPSINSLKEEWGKLTQEKRQLYAGYKELRDRDRALSTAKYNCDRILNISPEELERQRQNRAQPNER